MRILFLIFLVFCTGCANTKNRVNQEDGPNAEQAYLVGSFVHSYRESFGRLALKVENTLTNSTFYIELQQPKNHRGISIIPVAPGSYKVRRLSMLGGAIGEEDISYIQQPELYNSFKVESGHLYYIGSFDGKSTNQTNPTLLSGGIVLLKTYRTYNLDVKNMGDEEILNEIRLNYPKFSILQFVNILSSDKNLNTRRAQ